MKAAITAHSGWSDYRGHLGGITSGGLTIAKLETAAAALGIDTGQFIKSVYQPPSVLEWDIEAETETVEAEAVEVEAEWDIEAEVETVETITRAIMAGSLADMAGRIDTLAGRALTAEVEVETVKVEAVEAIEAVEAATEAAPVASKPSAKAAARPVARIVERKARKDAFGITLTGTDNPVEIWNDAAAPSKDVKFIWDKDALAAVLSVWNRGAIPWLFGPRGVGKTTFCEQFAAWTGRGFTRIGFHSEMEAVNLYGMTVPEAGGSVAWQDGALTAAMRRAGTIILLDEPTLSPPGMLHSLQTVLDTRRVTLETGEVVEAAKGVVFIIADNTAGHGDETGEYHGTGPMNAAFLDRSSIMIEMGYLAKGKEISLVETRTGIPAEAAAAIVSYAGLTRQRGHDCAGLSPRRLFAWAGLVADGFSSEMAFKLAVINAADPGHVETYRQLETGDLRHDVIDALARGEELPETAPVAGNEAAADFGKIDLDSNGGTV